MVRTFIRKLQKRLSILHFTEEGFEVPTTVPDDVKEGHFAVLAMNGSEKKRFVVKIDCLSNSSFLRLLEQAEQEYGFEQSGTLVVPCRPQELEKILKSS
uniref:Small auxin up regulated protein n=1 Tax=Boehmeria nivea TaxID=83906 RepID=A0A172J1Z6_BOENI|nr:small auxin up regulated protein [Boehmeria nivea]